jgi:predicted nuclease of predicted toxin-antitoxin system
MKLLLDANLSRRLTKQLADFFQDVAHVDNIGLKIPAKDIENQWFVKLCQSCICKL